jgi:hypothetical protein
VALEVIKVFTLIRDLLLQLGKPVHRVSKMNQTHRQGKLLLELLLTNVHAFLGGFALGECVTTALCQQGMMSSDKADTGHALLRLVARFGAQGTVESKA